MFFVAGKAKEGNFQGQILKLYWTVKLLRALPEKELGDKLIATTVFSRACEDIFSKKLFVEVFLCFQVSFEKTFIWKNATFFTNATAEKAFFPKPKWKNIQKIFHFSWKNINPS